ncbi:FAD-dependent oxidoreductase [Lentzea sp. JNUCC 0626]|uniref:FAD-dependent oxidoreductase n=1 Tax=Lentzea sp. JNUCC 0626 TaxID=3367513 RepID=UPI00374803A3
MDVLVVGAGPVGLMAGYELLRRGVPVRIIDAATAPATTSRAAAMHARTIELLDQVGLYDRFAALAVDGRGIAFHVDGTEMASMDATFTAQATRFDQVWFLDQVITERLLRDAVEELGGRVEWGVRLLSLSQDDEAVTATLECADGTRQTVTTSWLVGADGGHSLVRRDLGIELQGDSDETWLIADAEVDFAQPVSHDRIRWVRADGESLMTFPLVGSRRWRLLDTVEVDSANEPAAVAKRFSRKLTRGMGMDVTVHTPTWVSVFTIQQRAVGTMQSGRCFLAGDAAHVHSPASGQGLNTGMQDAINLAWKLAAVTRGTADRRLLDTYSAERVPVGQALLTTTRMATMLVAIRNETVDKNLPALFETISALPPLFHAINQGVLGGMSGLGIAYTTSPLTVHDSETTLAGPAPGQRVTQVRAQSAADDSWQRVLAALRSGEWTLLAASATSLQAPDWAILQHVEGPASADLALTSGRWLLVRPDGYVTARGHDQRELADAIERMPL